MVHRRIEQHICSRDGGVRPTTSNHDLRQAALELACNFVHAARLIGHRGQPDHIRPQSLDGIARLLRRPTLDLHVEDMHVRMTSLTRRRSDHHDPQRVHVRELCVGVVGLDEDRADHRWAPSALILP